MSVAQTKLPQLPVVGERYVDDTGRSLVVLEVNPTCQLGRHVVGKVDGQPYATDIQTFLIIWRGEKKTDGT